MGGIGVQAARPLCTQRGHHRTHYDPHIPAPETWERTVPVGRKMWPVEPQMWVPCCRKAFFMFNFSNLWLLPGFLHSALHLRAALAGVVMCQPLMKFPLAKDPKVIKQPHRLCMKVDWWLPQSDPVPAQQLHAPSALVSVLNLRPSAAPTWARGGRKGW